MSLLANSLIGDGLQLLPFLCGALTPSGGWTALLVFGSIAACILVGTIAAKSLRMRDYGWKFSLILCTLVVSLLIILNTWDPATQSFNIPRGVDLKGGVIIVFEVDDQLSAISDAAKNRSGSAKSGQQAFDMNALVNAIKIRIDPTGTKEIVVRPFGEKQIEIVIPAVGETEMDRIVRTITTAGVLQFRIVANRRDHQGIIALAEAQSRDPERKRLRDVRDGDKQVAIWSGVARDKVKRTPGGNLYFKTPISFDVLRNGATGEILNLPPDAQERLEDYLAEKGIDRVEVLMYTDDGFNVNGSHLGVVFPSRDNLMNPCLSFSMKGEGIGLFGALTGQNRPDGEFRRRLGILLDNELISAPELRSQIEDRGEITGSFTTEEVDDLVGILQAGSLPVALHKNPISTDQISPLLGQETIRKGTTSIWVSTAVVFAFMFIYYRFSGFIACFALFLNLILIVACMILIKAPFTMPGLAGLVLTIGMAVDANVLIYERMREEIARGSAVRLTIRNGFNRAMATIIDSNLTTVITGLILYVIGTEQLRGFAVTLTLGLIVSMYTAIFVSRVCFDVTERQRWLKDIKMMPFFGTPNIDFMKLAKTTMTGSAILIAIGLMASIRLGAHMLDTDLGGGTSVTAQFKQPIGPDEVRDKIGPKFNTLNSESTVTGINVDSAGLAKMVKIDSSIEDVDQVEKLIAETFRDASGTSLLETHTVSFSPPSAIASSSPKLSPTSDPSPPISTENTTNEAKSNETKSNSSGSNDSKPETDTKPKAEQPEGKSGEGKSGDCGQQHDAEATNGSQTTTDTQTKTESPSKTDNPQSGSPPSVEKAVVPAESTQTETGKPAPDLKSDANQAKSGGATVPSTENAPVSNAPVSNAPVSNAPVSNAPAPIAQSQSTLTFGSPVDAGTLKDAIVEAAKVKGFQINVPALANPEWDGRDSAQFSTWTVQIPLSVENCDTVLKHLAESVQGRPVWPSSSKIGAQVASDTKGRAVAALILSCLAIVAYVWFRFQHLIFGIAAVVALVHDVLVTVALLALSHWLAGPLNFLLVEEFRISLAVVAALLTIIGYSINDTIVIFDRIREVRGKSPRITGDMINLSVNQTLSRTILTFTTTFMVVVILYCYGGEGIHAFAFSLLVGTIAGVYSTVFIASPLVLWIAGTEKKQPVKDKKIASSVA